MTVEPPALRFWNEVHNKRHKRPNVEGIREDV